MFDNPYLAHHLAKERISEARREAKRARLIGFSKGPDQHQGRPWASIFEDLLALREQLRIESDGLQTQIGGKP
jgi:hypothetical protein